MQVDLLLWQDMINTIIVLCLQEVGVELEDEDEGKELMLMLGRWLLFKKKREY